MFSYFIKIHIIMYFFIIGQPKWIFVILLKIDVKGLIKLRLPFL